MKFPIDKCVDCGLDLTTAEPAGVKHPSDELTLGDCPKCERTYILMEGAPPEPEAEVEAVAEAEPEVEPEPEAEPEAEPEPPSEPAAEAEPEPQPEPEPETPEEEKGGD